MRHPLSLKQTPEILPIPRRAGIDLPAGRNVRVPNDALNRDQGELRHDDLAERRDGFILEIRVRLPPAVIDL